MNEKSAGLRRVYLYGYVMCMDEGKSLIVEGVCGRNKHKKTK